MLPTEFQNKIIQCNAMAHSTYSLPSKLQSVYAHTINHADYGLQLEGKINHISTLFEEWHSIVYLSGAHNYANLWESSSMGAHKDTIHNSINP